MTVITDGGFTGRGIGSASADVDDAELRAMRPESWREEYASRGADLVRYTLSFGETSVSWTDGAEIPRELEELFGKVWKGAR